MGSAPDGEALSLHDADDACLREDMVRTTLMILTAAGALTLGACTKPAEPAPVAPPPPPAPMPDPNDPLLKERKKQKVASIQGHGVGLRCWDYLGRLAKYVPMASNSASV